MAYSVWRRANGWPAWVGVPALQEFSFLDSVQPGSGAHRVPYPMATESDFPGLKAAGS
jgi:hypothetical protein